MKAKDKGVNVQTFAKYTHMQVAYAGRDWFNVHTSDLNRPAIQFAGYFQYFSAAVSYTHLACRSWAIRKWHAYARCGRRKWMAAWTSSFPIRCRALSSATVILCQRC